MADPEARIMELEIKVSFQERTLETLNEVMVEQGKRIDELERQQQQLLERLRSALEGEEEGPDADVRRSW